MLKRNLISLFLISIYIISCILIYNQKPIYNNKQSSSIISKINLLNSKNIKDIKSSDNFIGTLRINKINLEKNFYDINNIKNNVEENVTLLRKEENLIVLAAHSGTGPTAYFNQLDKLSLNDEINLTYKEKNYNYKITKIEEQIKDGTIEIENNNINRLVLTTCSQKNKNNQLIIISELITQKNEG